MLSVRYSISPTQFAKQWEPYCHALAIGYPLATAGIGLVLDMYDEFNWASDAGFIIIQKGARKMTMNAMESKPRGFISAHHRYLLTSLSSSTTWLYSRT